VATNPAMRRNKTLRKTCCLFLILSFTKTALAQDSSITTKPIFADASLLYDFPESFGMTVGIYLPLQSITKNFIYKNGKSITKQKDIVTGVNAGFYRYPYNYTGVIFSPFIAKRRYYHPSFFTETAVSIGMLRTFYDGKVYKVDASGNVTELGLFGRFYATTGFSYGFNWLLKSSQHNIALQLKPSLWFQYPYNSFIKPHASLEAGVKYEIAKRNVSVRTIHKSKRR